ncbi:DsbA family protein, partial [Roseateles sp. P5_E11]
KVAMLKAYFTDGRDVSNHEVLLSLATAAGLPEAEARELLAGKRYAEEVAAAEAEVHAQGIHAVPAVIVNQRHLIQGGQSVEVFEKLLRQVMDEPRLA